MNRYLIVVCVGLLMISTFSWADDLYGTQIIETVFSNGSLRFGPTTVMIGSGPEYFTTDGRGDFVSADFGHDTLTLEYHSVSDFVTATGGLLFTFKSLTPNAFTSVTLLSSNFPDNPSISLVNDQISWDWNPGDDVFEHPDFVATYQVSNVPEPSSLVLLVSGLLIAARNRRLTTS